MNMFKKPVNMLTLLQSKVNTSTSDTTVKEINNVQSKFKSIISHIERYKSSYYSDNQFCPSYISGEKTSKTITETLNFIIDFKTLALYNTCIGTNSNIFNFNHRG